jgi:hypothetical protein
MRDIVGTLWYYKQKGFYYAQVKYGTSTRSVGTRSESGLTKT